MKISRAVRDIAIERQRQIDAEGWTPAHDDMHSGGEMAAAAAMYALPARYRQMSVVGNHERYEQLYRYIWPWDEGWWKATTRRRDLVKAGALIAAEIERIDRLDAAMPETTAVNVQRTRGDRLAEAVALADRLFPDKHWLFGKGRITPTEPLYGFRVFEPGNEDTHIAEGEHDDPVECVWLAVGKSDTQELPEVSAL
ncbi:hypothetical protein [Mesorhizobium sp. M0715]|uniref:hypothetical protein n=1 Tax=Mesorhizobium sp. M0715 TaxID=2956990 RepID=UPI003338D45A